MRVMGGRSRYGCQSSTSRPSIAAHNVVLLAQPDAIHGCNDCSHCDCGRGCGGLWGLHRFIVLAREPLVIRDPAPGKYKTSIVFSLAEGPGMLYKVPPPPPPAPAPPRARPSRHRPEAV